MTKNLSRWAAGAIGAAALLVSSCAYDPSYSSAGVSYGYGDGYGYGGSSFSTSIFIGTGDPRWGYDPYTYSYYDYYRHAYYDPYLYGYYPVGFRPYAVYGVPHPGGWRPGRGYCPPPSHVTVRNLSNYRNRENAYRSSNYSWANQVHSRDAGPSARSDSRQGNYNRATESSRDFRPNNGGFQHSEGGSRNGSDNRGPSRPSPSSYPAVQSQSRPQYSNRPQREAGSTPSSQNYRGPSSSGHHNSSGGRSNRPPQKPQPSASGESAVQSQSNSAPSGDGHRGGGSPGQSRGDGGGRQFR